MSPGEARQPAVDDGDAWAAFAQDAYGDIASDDAVGGEDIAAFTDVAIEGPRGAEGSHAWPDQVDPEFWPTGHDREHPRGRRLVLGVAATALVLLGGLGLLRLFVFEIHRIPSASMTPTLEIDDRVLINRLDTSTTRGDIITYQRANVDPLPLVGRVIAVGGETVTIIDNQVFIDDQLLVEPYLGPSTLTSDLAPTLVPDGAIFVMGDNREAALDSRQAGAVDVDDVIGVLALQF